MFYLTFYNNFTTAREPKLGRIRIQDNLDDLVANQKLQIFSWGKRMHSARMQPLAATRNRLKHLIGNPPSNSIRLFNQAAPRVSNVANAIASRG
jgi:Spy/CpxP family protein refolding chaperone